MNWGLLDFVFAGALVMGVGVIYALAVRMTTDRAYRAAVAVALATAFVLIWANAAVGVIGSEDNPANLIYVGVIVLAILGSLATRFRPKGMAWVMLAVAIAQVAVDVISLAAGFGSAGSITVFFAALWLLAAWLFRKAA
jgi:hypothetical protein